MQRSVLRLYAPFLILAIAQAAFVVWLPSSPEQSVNAFAAPTEAGIGSISNDGSVDGPSVGELNPDGSVASAMGSNANAGNSTAPGKIGNNGGNPNGITTRGDTSHCKGDRQTDVIYNSPPCAPKFTGDNGGATYRGVTRDEIKFVMMQCQSNEQVQAILKTQGLAASDDDYDAMGRAAVKFVNARYEMYGRKLTWNRMKMDCPTTPPDPAKARQAAAEIAKKNPAFVYVASGGSSAADVFAQNSIVSLGVQWGVKAFYAGRRPFRWDIFPTATETAQWMSEYYCNKMAGKPASNAGRIIHESIGDRTTPRKLAIIVPDNGTGTVLPAAQDVSRAVKECSGVETPIFTYQSDINRGPEQARVISAGLIDAKVTTVTCMCDSIFPVFITQGMTQNNYYPEHMLASMGLLDYDVLGRLYDPAQWSHAFGPSQLVDPVPFEQSDTAKIWRAAGNEGLPCEACNLLAMYVNQAGSMIQLAGANLNPGTIEGALVGNRYSRGGWSETRGNPHEYLHRYGPGDYNAISDFREVYWDALKPSTIDGKSGSYVSINKGRRYTGGEVGPSFDIPPKAT